MDFALYDNSPIRRAGMQSYFDYMAERTGAGRGAVGQPEVLEFTGLETVDVEVIQPVFAPARALAHGEGRACSS